MNDERTVIKVVLLFILTAIYFYFAWDYGTIYLWAGLIVFAIVFAWIISG